MLHRLMVAGPVVAFVVFIVVEAAPNFVRARTDIAGNACIHNLRGLDAAIQQWSFDNGKATNDLLTWDDIRPYLSKDGTIPSCPQGGKYTLGRKGKPPACSYPGHRLPRSRTSGLSP